MKSSSNQSPREFRNELTELLDTMTIFGVKDFDRNTYSYYKVYEKFIKLGPLNALYYSLYFT